MLSILETPAFVYDAAVIRENLALLSQVRRDSGARILYSIKALPLAGILEIIRPQVDGFSASSLFEARLASEVLGNHQNGALHITSPGLRVDEIDEIAELCDAIAFNSLEQFRRLGPAVRGRASIGLRVNPRLSFLDDPRHDPCRPFSKLGVPIEELAEHPDLAETLDGLHFHTQFESRSVAPLRATLDTIEHTLGEMLDRLHWINLGGGYLIEREDVARELATLIRDFRERHGLEVYLEPGKGIVGRAGSLVASVIDRFERDGKAIAVLDTGVHHLPEVFEYQKSAALAGHDPDGPFEWLLAGCTCLAGDVFGTYRLAKPLEVGERVVFEHVGAYALARAHRFNGYDLPTIYIRGEGGHIRLLKRHGYDTYRAQWT